MLVFTIVFLNLISFFNGLNGHGKTHFFKKNIFSLNLQLTFWMLYMVTKI